MILQNIVFPTEEDGNAALYYKSTRPVKIQGRQTVEIPEKCVLDLFTYFNALSVRRWRTFTSLDNILFRAEVKGRGRLQLVQRTRSGMKTVAEASFSAEEGDSVSIPVCLTRIGNGFLCPVVRTAPGESAVLSRAGFETECAAENQVRTAAVICTYKRERYVLRNVGLIERELLGSSPLSSPDALDIFIIDNGRTLDPAGFRSPRVRLIPNANTGGAGGFTRGMIEALRDRNGYTHILLMDDDIRLEPESLARTHALLSFLKPGFSSAVVGGAMLRSDSGCILEEAGADWPGDLKPFCRGMDMGLEDSLFRYDGIGNAEYQAWWYCCIPRSIIRPDNLPLPFFVHGDDVEYGLRNFRRVLQLNGICVWHDTFENKRPSTLEYYDARNHLIIEALYGKGGLGSQLKLQFKRSTALILRMRYRDVLLNVRGIRDFLRGPKWWAGQDTERLHQEILSQGYRYDALPDNVEGLERVEVLPTVTAADKLKCYLTLNGAFLPKKKAPLLVPCGSNPFVLYRRKSAYLWDPSTDGAIPVTFSFTEMCRSYWLLMKALLELTAGYRRARKAYRKEAAGLGTEEYWGRYMETTDPVRMEDGRNT